MDNIGHLYGSADIRETLCLLNMINYGYQGVDTASYRLLRFGEKLVQIWCSEDMEPGHNKSLVQWIQDRGLCMA